MTKPSRKPSRYDREKPYHFEVRMKLWLSRIIFHVWTIELRRWPKVTFQDRCLGFPNHPYFLIFMKMALIYDPLNDIDLFAWGLPFDHDIYEMAISFKHPVKITPPTKQRLFREGLGLILLGFDGSPLKISRTPQILKEKAPYVVMYAIRRFWRGSDEKLLQWSPPRLVKSLHGVFWLGTSTLSMDRVFLCLRKDEEKSS